MTNLTIERDLSQDERIKMTKPACQAVAKRNWQGLMEFFQAKPEALFVPLWLSKDTAFHVAASNEQTKLLRDLLEIVEPSRRLEALTELKDRGGNTVLHEVATTDSVDTAKLLVAMIVQCCEAAKDEGNESQELDDQLAQKLKVKNGLGETPLFRAAALGKINMVKYLAEEIEKACGNVQSHFYRHDPVSILHFAVLGQHFDTALWLLRKGRELALGKEDTGLTCLHLLALTPSAFRSTTPRSPFKELIYSLLPSCPDDDDDEHQSRKHSAISRMHCAIWKCLAKGWPTIGKIWEEKKKHKLALKLVRLLVKEDTSWNNIDYKAAEDYKTITIGKRLGGGCGARTESTTPSGNSRSSPQTPLLMAASTGIIEIVEAILKEYPEAVDHVGQNDQNILQIAITHRRKDIFEFIKKNVISIHALASKIDNNGYTILHHVADMKNYHGTRTGPAFKLQKELQWFQRVKDIMPRHYEIHQANNNMTAKELFDTQHKDQLDQAKEWVKDTSKSCSTVAVLVASVAFAAAYTMPGGTNKWGRPILLHSSLFSLFAIMDVFSLASSFTSVVMFLSIFISPFELNDFINTIPQKMIIGFTFLFLSVITTMITFTATLLLTTRSLSRHWTSALICAAAFFPVLVFVTIQLPLYIQLIISLKDFIVETVMWQLAFSKKKKKKRN